MPVALDIDLPTRAAPALKVHGIQLHSQDINLQLSIPELGPSLEATSLEATQARAQYGTVYIKPPKDPHEDPVRKTHVEFCHLIANIRGIQTEKVHRQCSRDINGIRKLFPSIKQERLRVCMAAWLAALCSIDDIMENIPTSEAEDCVRGAIHRLQRNGQLLLYINATHLVFTTNPGAKPESPNASQHKLVRVMLAFKNHCSVFLPEKVLTAFIDDICRTLTWFLHEMTFRSYSHFHTLDDYMGIRRHTMGIDPIFSLFLHLDKRYGGWSEALTKIQKCVAQTTGLQNDLLGLEKDLQTGEPMNAVIFASGRNRGELRTSIDKACGLHNALVAQVLGDLHTLQKRVGCDPSLLPLVEFAGLQVLFIRTHFQWCLSAKRYKAT